MTIPESVIETVVEESVLVTDYEPAMSIPESEPTQNLPLTTSDQPSSSTIQILDQPGITILESEFIDTEILKISKDMEDLVQLRGVPTLSIIYEDNWAALKNRIQDVSQKCIKIQAAAVESHLRALHLTAKAKAPLLFLANAPFYPESDYVSREAKLFQMLKQKVLKQQEESQARKDRLLQGQLAMEETIKQQAAFIEKQSAEFNKLSAIVQELRKKSNP